MTVLNEMLIKWGYCRYGQRCPEKESGRFLPYTCKSDLYAETNLLFNWNQYEAGWENLLVSKSPKLIESRGSIQTVFDNIKRHVKKLSEEDRFTFDSLNLLLGGQYRF